MRYHVNPNLSSKEKDHAKPVKYCSGQWSKRQAQRYQAHLEWLNPGPEGYAELFDACRGKTSDQEGNVIYTPKFFKHVMISKLETLLRDK